MNMAIHMDMDTNMVKDLLAQMSKFLLVELQDHIIIKESLLVDLKTKNLRRL